METYRVQMKGELPWLVRWACCAGTRDFCPSLAALVGPVQNITFLITHYFSSFVPIAQQAGQAVTLPHLALNVCLWFLRLLAQLVIRFHHKHWCKHTVWSKNQKVLFFIIMVQQCQLL
jgi:hypothetical protein